MSGINYRQDIDGLRAIAVMSVIVFHINPAWLPGGFLGVDIFFVISGFLITLLLLKEMATNHKLRIVDFYARRLKRIIPALYFMLTFALFISTLILTPHDLIMFFKSSIWSAFSAANIFYYSIY